MTDARYNRVVVRYKDHDYGNGPGVAEERETTALVKDWERVLPDRSGDRWRHNGNGYAVVTSAAWAAATGGAE